MTPEREATQTVVQAQAVAVDNPYWDAIRDHVEPDDFWGHPTVGSMRRYRHGRSDIDFDRWQRESPQRHDLVRRFAWTITDPDTVAFVAVHSRGRVVDPMAGTGYWGFLLAQAGVDVISYDAEPGTSIYHKDQALHSIVTKLDGVDAAVLHSDRTLLLARPPYDSPDGAQILDAYTGSRVVYIGEQGGGCCGDDEMHEMLCDTRVWVEVAEHRPVQWFGIHDYVTVYDRVAV